MNGVVLRRGMIGLTVIGLGVAIYLTYVHYAGINPACTAGQSCIKVQTSQWSRLDGIPVALLGLIGYVLILGSLLVRDREESRLATLGLTLTGFGFSAYLTYRELFSIHAICEWCASSAVILTVLLACAVARYLMGPADTAAADGAGGPAGASAPVDTAAAGGPAGASAPTQRGAKAAASATLGVDGQ